MRTRFTRRSFLRRAGIAVSASLVAACQPAVVEKVVEVEKEVTRLVPAKERIEFSWSGVLGWENFWVNGLFPKFREMHPEIDEMKFIPQTGTIADWTQQAMNMAAAGTLPDALNTSLGTEYHILSKTLVYVPLDDFVQRDNYDLSIHYEVGLTGCTVDGRLHGLPGNCQPGHVVLYYNPNLFDEAGIPYPTYEWSTEDATEAAMKLTKDTTGDGYTDQWGYAPPTSQTGICGWIRSYGGDALSEDSRTSTLDTKPAYDAYKWVYDLHHTYKVAPPPEAQTAGGGTGMLFINGKLALMQSGTWYGNIQERIPEGTFEAKVVPSPTGPTGKLPSWSGINPACVTSSSKHKDLAWDFCKLFCGPIGAEIKFKMIGECPCLQECDAAAYALEHPFGEVFLIGQQGALPPLMPANLRFREWLDEWTNLNDPLWTGDEEFTEAYLKKINEGLQVILDKPTLTR